MGNSTGNFDDYWRNVHSNPRIQGGFIWDFVDQGFQFLDFYLCEKKIEDL